MRYFFLALLLCGSLDFYAQTGSQIPMDSSVRYGRLSNGMTYYIKHNNFPKGYADFQIFHAVGAIQEEDNQNGLAHFLEHMAFKGLNRFPGKSMTNYLEGIGVKFGANLNASTTTDYTRYLINQVPVTRQGIIDTCLMILADWSGSISATPQDIETERGVIKEEWRTRTNANVRANQALSAYYFKDSKYALRSVIGDMRIIENFKRDELMDFYHKWYRPDLQAIGIVGDFNADSMETAVIREFSKILPAVIKKKKVQYTIPNNNELIYGTFSDREITNNSISLLFKHPAISEASRSTQESYVAGYLRSLMMYMMNQRWIEVSDKKELDLKNLDFSYGNFSGDKDVFGVSGEVRDARMMPAFRLMLSELERFRRYGFTQSELDIAKATYKRHLEKNFVERDKQSNTSVMNGLFDNYIYNDPLPNAEFSYRILSNVIDTVSLAGLNAEVKKLVTDKNRIVTVVAGQKDSSEIPSKKEIETELSRMADLKVVRYSGVKVPVLTPQSEPVPSAIMKSEQVKFGATLWHLSNGAKVYLLPTKNKKDEILFDAYSKGGSSVLSNSEFQSARLLTTALTASGVGSLSSTDLARALNGKIVYVTPYFSEFEEGFGCATSPSDLETTLKLMYMYFKEPRFNAEDFEFEKKKIKDNLLSRKKNPFSALQDSVFAVRSNFNLRGNSLITDPDELPEVSLDTIRKVYKKAFSNPGDFIFYFVGTVDTTIIKPLIEKYIGGLRGDHRSDTWKDLNIRPPKGKVVIDFKNKMETPKSTVFMEYTQLTDYSFKKGIEMQLLQGILESRLNELLRNQKSGVYTPAVECSLKELPVGQASLIVSFDTEPDLLDELVKIVGEEMNRLATQGIAETDLEKSKEFVLKSYDQGLTNNYYWRYLLSNFIKSGRDNLTGNKELVESIKSVEITSLLKEIVKAGNIAKVIMRPE